ncbi:MAG: metallophosphoesterase family protein [Candidatus Heimdallarchaeota archaeon]|nr:metallophosphoesterase family protein [Candidatus Heimdallarchaeota archaeon]
MSDELQISKEERDSQTKVVTSESILKESDVDEQEVQDLFQTTHLTLDATKIAVIGDMHSNAQAFDAVWADMQTREYDAVICLGDLVGYYTQPNEVVELTRKISDITIQGNHDFALIEPEKLLYTTLQEGAQAALDHNKSVIKPENADWIKTLPLKVHLTTPHATLTLVHGDPLTIFGYIYGVTPEIFEQSIKHALAQIDTEYLLVGHTHIQGEYIDDKGRRYVNPGSIGQPRDKDPRAAYAIIDLEKKENQLIRVEYDMTTTMIKVHNCCLPSYLASRLLLGE